MTTESSSGNTNSTFLVGKYELGQTLGTGNNSVVKLARHVDTGYNVAVKILKKQIVLSDPFRNRNYKDTDKEISAMKMIRHENVAHMYEIVHSRTKICIVTELVTGGQLFDKLPRNGRFTEAEARKYFQQLIFAVDYCHIKGVSHRNLKPENLLVDADGNLKVTDFGLSTLLPQQVQLDGLLSKTCGLAQYMPPEVICNLEHESIKTDIWSCGVILFLLLSGYLPFNENNATDIFLKALKPELEFPSYFSPRAKRLIKRMLDRDPSKRIKIEEIIEDEWFKGYQSPRTSQENIGFDDSQNAGPAAPVRNVFGNIYTFLKFNRVENFFKQVFVKREKRFSSKCSANEIISRIEHAGASLGFNIKNRNYVLKIEREQAGTKVHLSIAIQIHEVDPPSYMVELERVEGDTLEFDKFYKDLSTNPKHNIWKKESLNAKTDGASTSTAK